MRFTTVFFCFVLCSVSWGQNPDWGKTTHLKVEGSSGRSADVFVLMKSEGEGDSLKCSFVTKHEQFAVKTNKWYPLPILLVNASDRKKPVDEAFSKSLSFPKAEHRFNEKEIAFQTTFRRGDFSFSALWRFVPAKEVHKDKETKKALPPVCVPKAELCAKIGYSDTQEKMVCLGEFKWLQQLVAIPHVSNWLRGIPTDVSGLRADYQYVDPHGEVKIDSVTYEGDVKD